MFIVLGGGEEGMGNFYPPTWAKLLFISQLLVFCILILRVGASVFGHAQRKLQLPLITLHLIPFTFYLVPKWMKCYGSVLSVTDPY